MFSFEDTEFQPADDDEDQLIVYPPSVPKQPDLETSHQVPPDDTLVRLEKVTRLI
jgi:hypothetical protein